MRVPFCNIRVWLLLGAGIPAACVPLAVLREVPDTSDVEGPLDAPAPEAPQGSPVGTIDDPVGSPPDTVDEPVSAPPDDVVEEAWTDCGGRWECAPFCGYFEQPYCGEDGRTYSSPCVACCSVHRYRSGECPADSLLVAEECAARGGVWGPWGLDPRPRCNLRTSDGGARCTDSGECEGWCIAAGIDGPLEQQCPSVGTCSEFRGVFGCFCAPPSNGVICVD